MQKQKMKRGSKKQKNNNQTAATETTQEPEVRIKPNIFSFLSQISNFFVTFIQEQKLGETALKVDKHDSAAMEQFVSTGGDQEIAEEMSIKKDENCDEKLL